MAGQKKRGEKTNEMEQENKVYEKFEILKELLPTNGKQKIEIITTASSIPEEMKKMYLNAFKKINFTNVDFIDIQDKHSARDTNFCKRVEKAHAVFFSGGDQFKLSAILGGTETVAVIREKYLHDKNFVVAGTECRRNGYDKDHDKRRGRS